MRSARLRWAVLLAAVLALPLVTWLLAPPEYRLAPLFGVAAAVGLAALLSGARSGLGVRRGEAARTPWHSKEFSERLISSSVDGILAFDRACRYTVWNPAMERISGLGSEQVLGRCAFEVFPFLKETGEDRYFYEALAGRAVVSRDRPYTVPESGRQGFFEGYYAPLHDEAGQVLGGLAVIRDVTERRQAEEERAQRAHEQAARAAAEDMARLYREAQRELAERQRAEEALREADRRKDEFLAMLAHELRNPLAPIRNAARILGLLAPADANLQRLREILERQVGHLSRLVDDLLEVSRVTRGKVQIRKEPVELAAVLAQAVETSRPLVEARRHELVVSLPPEPVLLEADVTRLAQVVANLLNNAAKYTPEGGHLALSAVREEEGVVVRVRDDGVGIAAELLPRVFELFVQADRSPARSEGGLGIGLTLVKSLVEMHGGTVLAHSDGPGKGSEFIVRLPALPSVRSPGIPGPAPPPPAGAPGRRVLIVDDNADAGQCLAMLLEGSGYTVQVARDGPAALEAARAFRPEVVLLDIGLPGMDGYEVARRLRQDVGLQEARLVALTGYGQEEDRRRSEEAGFDAHLIKPADSEALHRVLEQPTPPG